MTQQELIDKHNMLFELIKIGQSTQSDRVEYYNNYFVKSSDTSMSIDDLIKSGRKFTL